MLYNTRLWNKWWQSKIWYSSIATSIAH